VKVILFCSISIDGKIARNVNDDLWWTGRADKKMFAELSRKIGVVIFGRRTYDQMLLIYRRLGRMDRLTKNRLIKVMTRKVKSSRFVEEQVEFTNNSPKDVLRELEDRGFGGVVIGGGAQINCLFLKQDLVDEIWLSLAPVLLGKGLDLVVSDRFLDKRMKLLKIEKIDADGVILKYRVLK